MKVSLPMDLQCREGNTEKMWKVVPEGMLQNNTFNCRFLSSLTDTA